MFYNLGDKRILYVIIAIFVIMHLGSYISNPDSLLGLVLSLPAVLIAITFHEFAHAFVADKLGDDTPRRQGRLTLNPLAHLDPVGSLMLVFAGFGWGKPVEINPRNFNRDRSMSSSEALVSVAGPAMNFILAILFTIILGITLIVTNSYMQISSFGTLSIAMSAKYATNTAMTVIIQLLLSCISINLGLGIFNLIPLPPLDGSKILRNILPYKAKNWYDANYQLLYFVFIIIWITPVISMVISPIITGAYKLLVQGILTLLGRVI